ncbi:O-antigen ligase domain-containing protein [Oxalobacteraceae bacterium OM1]|nr:O-antigen ligase domain-containing protein [Oxalobacteraceae bacterium OM1]
MHYGATHTKPNFDGATAARRGISLAQHHTTIFDAYHTAALIVILLVTYFNLPVYVHTLNESVLPKDFYFVFLLILAPIIVVRAKALTSYLTSPFALWSMALLLLNVIHLVDAFLAGDPSQYVAADEDVKMASEIIYTRMQFLVMAIILGFAFFVARTAAYQRVFVFAAVAIPCLVGLDFAEPGLLYPLDVQSAVLGRPGATFINPTIASEVMLLVFLMACNVIQPKYRVPLFLMTSAAIFLTFTRSATLACLLLFVFFAARRLFQKSEVIAIVIAIGVFAIVFGDFYGYLNGRQDIAGGLNNIDDRLNFFSSFNVEDDSAQSRASALLAGLELFLENPLAGAGAGATQFWQMGISTHNQLVLLAAEYGVLGIVSWLALAAILWRGRYFSDRSLQVAMCLLFIFMTMFTHNMFDFPYWLVTFALVSGQSAR